MSDDALRPASLDDVIGQTDVVDALRIALDGAQARGELPGHMLFSGPAGTGKTTLSLCVASAIGSRLSTLIGPQVKMPEKDLFPVLFRMQERDVLFIDEIHRIWRPAQEYLYPVMEDGSLILDNGRTVELPEMVIIGATTDPQLLTTPMLDRFSMIFRLRLYTPDELMTIAQRAAGKLGCVLADDAAMAVAKAASGVPRVALRLVRAARDYAFDEAGGPVKRIVGVPWKTEARYAPITIGAGAVARVLASPAYVWREEGRDAG